LLVAWLIVAGLSFATHDLEYREGTKEPDLFGKPLSIFVTLTNLSPPPEKKYNFPQAG